MTHVKHATRDLTQQNIAASYSLAAQFLSLAAAALQFPITSKLCWSDLGVIETSEARLASKLSRVNIADIRQLTTKFQVIFNQYIYQAV